MTVVVSWVRFVLAVCLRTRNVDRARRLIALSARLIGAEAVGSLHHLEACAEQQNSLAPLDTWPGVYDNSYVACVLFHQGLQRQKERKGFLSSM